MQKTVVVLVERSKTHPIYKKRYIVSTKFKAHDEKNTCNIGDVVEITETRPMSKDKHFEVTKVVTKGAVK
jgi:small subunit ribosomal protein S17